MPGPNPRLYRELSRPFASFDEADAAMNAFHADLEAIRVKHRIADVLVVVSVAAESPEEKSPGGEVDVTAAFAFGHQLKALPLAAYAHGYFERDHREIVQSLLAGGKQRRKD